MSQIAPDYTMKRMLDDYINRFYNKLATRSAHLREGNFAEAKRSQPGKKKWQNIGIASRLNHSPVAKTWLSTDRLLVKNTLSTL